MTTGRAAYWRAIALVFSGTAAAQTIPLLGSLIIARLFVPVEFGAFMAWLGVASMAGVFSTGRLEMALALEPDGPARAQAAVAVAITTGLLLLVVTVAVAVAWPFVSYRCPEIPPALILLFVPATAALAAAQIWQAWAAAEGRFKALSMMRIVQAAVVTGLQILAGIISPSAVALALAHTAGVVAGVALIATRLPLPRLENGRAGLLRFWARHRRFPIYALPADTVNTAAAQLPLTILAARFGADTAGFVALAFRTLGAPISLMGSAVLDVFKRRASESWRLTGSCRAPYLETFLVLLVGSIGATAVFLIFGVEIFVLAFGSQWRPTGEAAVILLPLFAMRFVASPLSYTFYIAEKQHIDLIWQIGLLAMTLLTLTSFRVYEDALTSYAVGYGVFYVVYLVLTYRMSAGSVNAGKAK